MDFSVFTFGGFFPYGFIKLMILLIMIFYIVFAGIIVRQETLMSRVIQIPFSPLLRGVVVIHFIASLVIFVLALLLL